MRTQALRQYLKLIPLLVAASFLQGCTEAFGAFLGFLLIIFLPAYLVMKVFGLFRSDSPTVPQGDYDYEYLDEEDDSEDLLFQIQGAVINRGARLELGSQVASGKFVLSDSPYKFNGYNLSLPMFYVGSPARSEVPDPSLLDPKLPIARKTPDYVHEMDYWPSYSDMNPSQRKVYLVSVHKPRFSAATKPREAGTDTGSAGVEVSVGGLA